MKLKNPIGYNITILHFLNFLQQLEYIQTNRQKNVLQFIAAELK